MTHIILNRVAGTGGCMRIITLEFFTLGELGAEYESQFHYGFLKNLVILRRKVGRPFIVTGGIRTQQYNNTLKGASKRSLHIWDKPSYADKGQTGCLAVDIKEHDADFRYEVLKHATASGWSVGIYPDRGFLHLDLRSLIGLTQRVFVS